ncbi:MAG: DUF720 domain-containing protein, partial [Chlamydiales bacterium]
QESEEKTPSAAPDAIYYAAAMIQLSYATGARTAQIGSDELQMNNASKQHLIQLESSIAYLQVTRKSMSSTALESLQSGNQQIDAQRSVISDRINELGQSAQIDMTNIQAVINGNVQKVQVDASLCQMETDLSRQIAQI